MNVPAPRLPSASVLRPRARCEEARFYAARFYVTFRCNSRCGYCNVWQFEKFKTTRELGLEEAKQILDQLHALGVRYIDLTGGEPTLHRSIVGIVRHAVSLGMTVEVTTNGNGIKSILPDVVRIVDAVNISLDTLDRETYKAIRGIDGLAGTMAAIDRVRAAAAGKLKILSVITQRNLDELPRLVDFAESIKVPINLSTMFLYFADQKVMRRLEQPTWATPPAEQDESPIGLDRAGNPEGAQDQINAAIARRLTDYLHRPFTQVNLHFIKRTAAADAASTIDCGANRQILTIGPDGRVMLPCYHAYNDSLRWDGDLQAAIRDPKFRCVRDHDVGRLDACRGCQAFPYIGISFSYRFDKQFLFQAFSEEIIKFKTGFLNPEHPDIVLNDPDLRPLLTELLRIIDDGLPDTPRGRFFYSYSLQNGAEYSPLFADAPSLADVIADNLREYCWDIVHSPHYVIRRFYRTVLPTLKRRVDDGAVARSEYHKVLSKLYRFHLHWWIWFIGRYYRCVVSVDLGRLSQHISSFLRSLASLLEEDTGRADLFLAASVLGCCSDELRLPASHAFSELGDETTAARYLRRNLSARELAKAARSFPPEFRHRLLTPTISVPARHEVAAAMKRELGDEAGAQSFARQLAANRDMLFDVIDHAVLLDQPTIDTLIATLRRTTDVATRGKLCRWLSDYALSREDAPIRPEDLRAGEACRRSMETHDDQYDPRTV